MNRLTLCVAAVMLASPCLPDDRNPANQTGQDLDSLTIEQLMNVKVEGAALHPQTLEDAPASVTILTAEDIRKYGFRTLAEALSSVRDFYSSNNHTYTTVGVRGFNLPGDYGSHLLVMVNGHNMVDNVADYMLFFGNDFPIEMNLIKRIEIIRGPSSALYGSNGMFATINIITKSPEDAGPPTLTTDAGSFGAKKGQVTASSPVGRNGAVLFSATVFNNDGQSPLYIPGFDSPQNNHGNAINMDGEKGYHFFSNFTWRNWTVTAAFSGRNKIQPVSWGNTVFNDRGTNTNDVRDFVDATYSRELSHGTLRWRSYYDAYAYTARADFPLEPLTPGGSSVDNNRAIVRGNWIGSALTYRFRWDRLGDLTVGTEGKIDLRNLQQDQDVFPAAVQYLNISRPDQSFAVFVQDERRLSKKWKLDLGMRYDWSAYRRAFLAPRGALNYQPTSAWTFKLLYGRSFRNPSAFQLFYDDGLSDTANPAARPEKADTVEFDIERKLGKHWNLLSAAYGYELTDALVGTYDSGGLIQYVNSGRVAAKGVSLELNGRPWTWLEATASYTFQQSHDSDADGILEDSPYHLAKLRFAVPVGRHFDVSSGMQYYSARRTLGAGWVAPVYLADFTLATKQLLPNFDFRLGIRNAFNRKYSDPAALNPVVDSIQQAGRTFFVELIAHGKR